LFERPHHRRIARILDTLDTDVMRASRCFFGGGTAIVLGHGEYRESVDIDLMTDTVDSYRELRSLVNTKGIQALFTSPPKLRREVRIDQYRIYCVLDVDDLPIKFELMHEVRLTLDPPQPQTDICGVPTLVPHDLAATKLMANSDRWSADEVFSRDLIDLAQLLPDGTIPPAAHRKALRAYGNSVERDLKKAVDTLLARDGRLKRCLVEMKVSVPLAEMTKRLEALHFPAP
jgi:hypothetical protein